MEHYSRKLWVFCLFVLVFLALVIQRIEVANPSGSIVSLSTGGDVRYPGPPPPQPPIPPEFSEADYIIRLGGIGYEVVDAATEEPLTSTSKACAAFNWAIGKLPSGGTVGFDLGQFNFATYGDVIYSGINVIGRGRDSVIFAEDNTNTWIIRVIGEKNVHFSNLRIEGNKENQNIPDGATNKGCGIYIRDSVNCSIQNVEANNCWARGINVHSCSLVTIKDCVAHDNGVAELGNIRYDNYVIARSDHCVISNSTSVDPWMDNIVIYGCSNVLVYNNTCTGTASNYGSGVVLDGDSMDQTRYITVRENLISNTNWGITGYNFEHVLIEDNDVSGVIHDGIGLHYLSSEYVIDVENVTIVNNRIQYGSENGIEIDSNNHNHMIKDNVISHVEEASIRISNAYDVTIWGNSFSHSCIRPRGGEGEGAIYLMGAPSQIDIQNNRIESTESSKPSILIDSGSQDVTVMNNSITERITNNAGAEATIEHNWKVGYETFPNSQTSYSFIHDFNGGTPTDVEIIWISDIGSRTCEWTADSIYITVNLSPQSSDAYDFEWHAFDYS